VDPYRRVLADVAVLTEPLVLGEQLAYVVGLPEPAFLESDEGRLVVPDQSGDVGDPVQPLDGDVFQPLVEDVEGEGRECHGSQYGRVAYSSCADCRRRGTLRRACQRRLPRWSLAGPTFMWHLGA